MWRDKLLQLAVIGLAGLVIELAIARKEQVTPPKPVEVQDWVRDTEEIDPLVPPPYLAPSDKTANIRSDECMCFVVGVNDTKVCVTRIKDGTSTNHFAQFKPC